MGAIPVENAETKNQNFAKTTKLALYIAYSWIFKALSFSFFFFPFMIITTYWLIFHIND